MPNLRLTGDPAADAMLDENPFAVLIGALLDQQYPMEAAFAGPKKIADRIGRVDPREIADYNPEELRRPVFKKLLLSTGFRGRWPSRIQALAQIIVDRYDGDASALWIAWRPRQGQRCCVGSGLQVCEQKARDSSWRCWASSTA
jgi:uncharacterized HhH-GPD family protein